MRFVLSGATGMIGSSVSLSLQSKGHEVLSLVRKQASRADQIYWNPMTPLDPNIVDGADAVIHLAGKNVATPWSAKVKAEILESRVQSTRSIAQAISQTKNKPKTFVCASAVGYYGSRGDEVLTEDSSHGDGFLAEVCQQWEEATKAAFAAGVRTVNLRTGVVLSRKGGALAKMLPAFRLGLAGKLGDGRQWMSWISLEDVVRSIEFAIGNGNVQGPINLVSPHPVTNDEFTRVLGRVLRRPTVISVPRFALKLILGEMAEGTLLASQRVMPKVLSAAAYQFLDLDLEATLGRILSDS